MSRRIDRDPKTETCRDDAGRQTPSTLEQIVDRYIFEHRDRARRELQYYAIQHTFEDAIKLAALSKLPNGKKHPHQYRISGHTLDAAKEVLLSVSGELRECRKFEDLIGKVDSEIRRPIKGIGKLAVYDIALRIGAYLELTPERVYIPSEKT